MHWVYEFGLDWFGKPEWCYYSETEDNIDESEYVFDGFEFIDIDCSLLFYFVFFMGVEFDLLEEMIVYCVVDGSIVDMMALVRKQVLSEMSFWYFDRLYLHF